MIGIFGGSFDPPHPGHESIINGFWKMFPEADFLFIIPNHQNPLKQKKTTEKEHILAMTKIMVACCLPNNNRILQLELDKPHKSYTIDTLTLLQKTWKQKLYLLLGEDNLHTFHQWKDCRKILEKTEKLLVYKRKHNYTNSVEQAILEKTIPMHNEYLDFSSAEIRNNRTNLEKLNPQILEYIHKHKLYE